jgi:hypothetical protein
MFNVRRRAHGSAGRAGPPRVGPVCALFCLFLAPAVAFSVQQQTSTPTLTGMRFERFLSDAAARAAEYFDLFTDLTAEETKTVEVFDDSGEVSRRRLIVSDFIIYQSQRDSSSVAEYRNVREVDGSPVGERQKRVEELFAKQSKAKSILDELVRVSREGSRYDFDYTVSGLTITQALPLQPWARSFFDFSAIGFERVAGREAVVIRYDQSAFNPRFGLKLSLPSELRGAHPLYRGRLWVDAETAQILRDEREVTVTPPAGGTPVVVQRAEFLYAPSRFGIPLPRRVTFTSLLRLSRGADGSPRSSPLYRLTFDYGPFKRFTASSDYIAAAPVDPDSGDPGAAATPEAPPEEASVAEPDASLGPEFGPGAPEGPGAPATNVPEAATQARTPRVRPPLPSRAAVSLPVTTAPAVGTPAAERPRRAGGPAPRPAPPPELVVAVRPPVTAQPAVTLPVEPERARIPATASTGTLAAPPPAPRPDPIAIRPPLPRQREIRLRVAADTSVPAPEIPERAALPAAPAAPAAPRTLPPVVAQPRAPVDIRASAAPPLEPETRARVPASAPPAAPAPPEVRARPSALRPPAVARPEAPLTADLSPAPPPLEPVARANAPAGPTLAAPPPPEVRARPTAVRPPAVARPEAPLTADLSSVPGVPGAAQPRPATVPLPSAPVPAAPRRRVVPPVTRHTPVPLAGVATAPTVPFPSMPALGAPPPPPAPPSPAAPEEKPRRIWRPPPS